MAKFSFYIKRLAPFDLAQRETSPAILFSASVSILDRIAKTWFDTFPQSLNVAETWSSVFPLRIKNAVTWDFVLWLLCHLSHFWGFSLTNNVFSDFLVLLSPIFFRFVESTIRWKRNWSTWLKFLTCEHIHPILADKKKKITSLIVIWKYYLGTWRVHRISKYPKPPTKHDLRRSFTPYTNGCVGCDYVLFVLLYVVCMVPYTWKVVQFF